ncbi:MAG: enoyl-CoA hydratase/isomerase family protein [Planctomycetes bacterium]|nr:enoyl-CoA hydratase/isomerase family protein [Planctomycetota bacterium]
MADPFLLDVSGAVATVTLNRPERLNALVLEAYAALRDYFAGLKKDRSVRAVVLTGAGRGFCTGGDVRDVIGPLVSMKPKQVRDFVKLTCDVVANIRKAPQPVIAALNGVAFGGGSVIALACDLRYAAPEAKIAFSFRGLSGADMGACWLLPRLVGLGRAADWLLNGATVSAEDALAAGLVTRVLPAGLLVAEARSAARRIAEAPREATAVTKRMLELESSMSFDQALKAEAKAQSALMLTDDFREAYKAFMEKREPRFNR